MRRLRVHSIVPYVSPKRGPLSDGQLRRNEALLALKNDGRIGSTGAADAFAAMTATRGCPVLGPRAALVPVPSSRAGVPGERAATTRLCAALVRQGLGAGVWPSMSRAFTVPSSSRSAAGDRLSVQGHYESLELVALVPATVVLVDDVVTRGSTLMGCLLELQKRGIAAEAFTCAVTLFPDDDLADFQVRELRWSDGEHAALNAPAGHW